MEGNLFRQDGFVPVVTSVTCAVGLSPAPSKNELLAWPANLGCQELRRDGRICRQARLASIQCVMINR